MTTDQAAVGRPTRRKWAALALLALTQFVLVLDAAIVSVALPSIGSDLHFKQEDLSWVVNAYTLMFGGFLLLGGRLADLIGRRRLFVIGILGFSLASLVGALATTAWWLVAARGVQGLAAAIVSPAALSLVLTTFTQEKERNRALGVWGAVAGSGGAAGVILGGVLTDWLGWESVLYVNVPIGIAAAILAPMLLAEGRASGQTRAFDLAGAITVTGGLGTLVYALVDANDAGWGSGQTVGLLVLAAALLGAFLVIEARSTHPLVPLGIFRLRMLRTANIIATLFGMAAFPSFYFLALYFQQVLDYSPIKAGFAEVPVALSIIVAAGLAPPVIARYGIKPPLVTGLVLSVLGLLWFSQISAGGSFLADTLGPSLVFGGAGFTFVAMTISATADAREDQAGLASGLINTTTQVGGALGLAILVAVATGATDDALAGGALPNVALNDGFADAFVGAALIAILGTIAALVLMPSRRRAAAQQQAAGEPEPVLAAAPSGD